MTSLADQRSLARAKPRPHDGWILAAMVLGASGLTLLMMASAATYVLRGGFGDPDDAMRLVEVRAWLSGQPWFDLTAHRLDPPLGASMHWSRLVDLPMALMIRLFGLFVDQAAAERYARVAVPALWLALLYLGMTRLATVLVGRAARATAVLGTLLSGAALISFQPGRIGHHAPETVALVFAVGAALASLDPARARQAAIAGALVALSLAMSLETLPFLGALCLAAVALWIMRGTPMTRALFWFGTGLGLALSVFFVMTVAPDRWLVPVRDAFGPAHLGAGMLGAGGAIVLSRAAPALRSRRSRLVAAGALGTLVCLFVALVDPTSPMDPFAGIDPLVRAVWLDNVVESQPLLAFMRLRPMTGLMIVLPVILGLVGSLVAARTLRGAAAARFAVIAGLSALGLALGFAQVRVFASVTPLALCGGFFAVARARERLAARGLRTAKVLAPALILPFTATAWALLLPADAEQPGDKAACLAPEALAPLGALPAGRVVAPIDLGSHVLVATPLDVFAAPYHRNNDGNRFTLDVFLAAPERAATLLADRRVAYVMTCAGEADRLAVLAPRGLAAKLRDGAVPAFLKRVPLRDTPYAVFKVETPGG